MSNFYSGSYILAPLAPATGLSVDKLNFIVCQLLCVAIGWPFKRLLPANARGGNSTRYAVATVIGCLLCVFCFGHQIVHLLAQGLGCLLLMRFWPRDSARYAVCAFAMAYLSFCHLLRMYYDYGGYTLDISGPLMIQTQRLSSLAFNVHDGEVVANGEEKKLTQSMRRHFVARQPSLLQYLSYMLHFQGILVGPFVFYVDFYNFMEGIAPPGVEPQQQAEHSSAGARMATVGKWALAFAISTLFLPGYFPVDFVTTEDYSNSWLPYKLLYLTVACFIIRHKYYFAWSMGELCYLASGCGFSGVNEKTGKPEYRLVQNFRFKEIETATSMKVAFDNWNIGTALWLRECIYERVSAKHGTAFVFCASAIWHGFYPGYYLTFITASFLTGVARQARRKIRPRLLHSANLMAAYDFVTGACSMTALNFIATAFTLMDLASIWQFWKSCHFLVHVTAVLLALGLKFAGTPTPKAATAPTAVAPKAE